jgi:hypothetical protein
MKYFRVTDDSSNGSHLNMTLVILIYG